MRSEVAPPIGNTLSTGRSAHRRHFDLEETHNEVRSQWILLRYDNDIVGGPSKSLSAEGVLAGA